LANSLAASVAAHSSFDLHPAGFIAYAVSIAAMRQPGVLSSRE
jgi:hypothetical protein